jgi:hypothetical protein
MRYTTELFFHPALSNRYAALVESGSPVRNVKGEVVFRVLTPPRVEGTYGRNGKEILPSELSEFVDIYV